MPRARPREVPVPFYPHAPPPPPGLRGWSQVRNQLPTAEMPPAPAPLAGVERRFIARRNLPTNGWPDKRPVDTLRFPRYEPSLHPGKRGGGGAHVAVLFW